MNILNQIKVTQASVSLLNPFTMEGGEYKTYIENLLGEDCLSGLSTGFLSDDVDKTCEAMKEQKCLNNLIVAQAGIDFGPLNKNLKKLVSLYAVSPYDETNALDSSTYRITCLDNISGLTVNLSTNRSLLNGAPSTVFEQVFRPYTANKPKQGLFSSGSAGIVYLPVGLDEDHIFISAKKRAEVLFSEKLKLYVSNISVGYLGN